MKIDEIDWEEMYIKAEKFLRDNDIQAARVCRSEQMLIGEKIIVRVDIPQKGNKQQVDWLKHNRFCFQRTGMTLNGKRIMQFGLYANKLN